MKNLLEVNDDTLSTYEHQKVILLNKISLICILFSILFDISYIILGRYPQMVIVTMAAFTIFLPTILIQRKGHYLFARIYFSSLLLFVMTVTCFYNISRGEYLYSENILIALGPLFIVMFEKRLKLFLYLLILVIFFIVRTYDYISRDAELDKMFFSSSMIYLVLFFGIYFFVNSYKSAFHSIYANQNTLIDQLASQKEQLERVNETKNKLFSIVAHDLKRPVHMLGGLLELDDKKLIDGTQKKQFNKQINENIIGINSLIENLLAWARSQLEGFTVDHRAIQLSSVLKKEMVIHEQRAKKKEIKLSSDFQENLTVQSDPDHLSLVVRNLINNSIKFTPKGGNVSIITAKNDSHIDIMIKDTGVGMNEATIAMIESKNFMPHSQGTDGEPGSGLGLSLSMDTLEIIGGSLTIKSAKGKGSEFVIRLPSA